MQQNKQIVDRVNIEGYGFVEFCQKIQTLLQQGYRFELESNAGYPAVYGTVYCATLVKEQVKEQQTTEELVVEPAAKAVDVSKPAVRGRPKI